ncbi:MAG: radical SAM protein [Phycisphaeraceae bacterium]
MTESTAKLERELDIAGVIDGSRRLTPAEALRLYHEVPLPELGRWADAVCRRFHGDDQRSYVIDRNVNYTNVCTARCTFCAFRRDLGEADAYVLSKEQLHDKVRELAEIGGTQVLLQGGMHPELPLSFYEGMLRELKAEFPQIHLHAFSPPEVVELVAICEIDGFPTPGVRKSHEMDPDTRRAKLDAILTRLREAGLDSIPGGGGEIFTPHVRSRIGIGKATADEWLEVMAAAHRQGMFTSATMMFGHIEGVADRIDHMTRVRDWQDKAIESDWPGRYVSFISWPFQRENTPLGRVPDWDRESGKPFPGDVLADAVFRGELDPADKGACISRAPSAGRRLRLAGASEYLRMQAISRLLLDNVASIGASWVTMGPKIGQLGLYYGANDLGSVMMEENVVSAAGTTYCLDEAVLCHLIRDAGFTPFQRDNRYQPVRIHDGPASPDLQVDDWSKHRTGQLHYEQVELAREGT